MLQFLSSFELGSLHPYFHDSLAIIDPPYTLTAKANCRTFNNSPVVERINVFTRHDGTVHAFILTVNGEVHKIESGGNKLIATHVIHITRLGTNELILVHEDGLVEFDQETFELLVPYGIKEVYTEYSRAERRVVIETMDNHLYIVRRGIAPKRLALKSVTTHICPNGNSYLYTLKDGCTLKCYRPHHT